MRVCPFAICLVWLAGCGLCGNTVKQEVKSPDGVYVAAAFVRDCGATTAFSAQVHVRKAGTKIEDAGNVYRGYLSDDIGLAWLSSTHLIITSGCPEVRFHLTNFHGITIDRVRR